MRRYRRRARSQYLLPFIILVSLGVFFILAFQLFGAFFTPAKGDAIYFLAEGRSKVLSFGTTEWENVYNGSKVKLGDSVKTLRNAKGVLQFYDGTILRMDEDTQLTLVDISKKNDYQQILIYLNAGKVWINKPKQNAIRPTDFVINTNFASYAITGTIFDLEKSTDEVLHVMKGSVQTDIVENSEGKIRVIESIPVGIGQQITLNDRVMQEYYERKSPSILGALDPVFQTTNWYVWNNKEDENPTDFSKKTSGTVSEVEATPEVTDNTDNTTVNVVKSDLAAPTLTSPKSASITTSSDVQKLTGKAAEGTTKLLLKQLLAGSDKAEKVLINSFDQDALTWNYEISEAKGNIKAGLNIYEFVGIDDSAKETQSLKVEITYEKADEPDLVINKPDSTTITKPKVTTIDGKTYKEGMTITTDGFTMVGTISGADALWVDDFKLSKFTTGSTAWSYNIKTSYGNLKPGLNTYQVYGVTEAGKKSEILTVKINFQPSVVTTATTTTTTTEPVTTTNTAETVDPIVPPFSF